MKNTMTLIGITGNIATGKSVVRRMLSNAGALGLDADVIAHRMIYPQGPAFQAVMGTFGKGILNHNSEINRAKLGEIVFNDPNQLEILDSIVHPAVTSAIQHRLAHTQAPLAALEAIKLVEAGLDEICDAVWVSHAPREVQLKRLLETRGVTEEGAQTRINAQPPQGGKLARADLVIDTDGPFQSTWTQVIEGLNDTIQAKDLKASLSLSGRTFSPCAAHLPHDELLAYWEDHSGENAPSLYKALGSWMVQPLVLEGRIQALLLWEDWNFTATLARVLPGKALLTDLASIMETFSTAARRQGCELLLLTEALVSSYDLNPTPLGFKQQKPANLGYPAWRDAAQALDTGGGIWAQILHRPLEAEGNSQLK